MEKYSGLTFRILRMALWCALLVAFSAIAQTQPAGPIEANGMDGQTPRPQSITIVAITGIVQFRDRDENPWKAVTVGQVLQEGAEFRTGPHSTVQFRIPPDQVITLDRLGAIKVVAALRDPQKVITELGMKYGRSRYEVEGAGAEHVATIRTGGSTLAVRGTRRMSLYDQAPFMPEAYASQPVTYRNPKGRTQSFGKSGASAQVTADSDSAAGNALSRTSLDPRGKFAARSTDEVVALASLTSPNGNIGVFEQLREPKGFKGSISGAIGVVDRLSITLGWTSLELPDTVNLSLVTPDGRTISQTSPILNVTTPQGIATGSFSGSNKPVNGVGAASITFINLFPAGQYTATAKIATPGPAQASLLARQGNIGNQKVLGFQIKNLDATDPTLSITFNAGPTAPSASAIAKRTKN